MPKGAVKNKRTKVQIIQDINTKLSALSHAEQKMVLAFALGVHIGLALQAVYKPNHTPEPKKPQR